MWLASDDVSWPCSFLPICELFDLDPDWLRRGLAQWVARATPHTRRGYHRTRTLLTRSRIALRKAG